MGSGIFRRLVHTVVTRDLICHLILPVCRVLAGSKCRGGNPLSFVRNEELARCLPSASRPQLALYVSCFLFDAQAELLPVLLLLLLPSAGSTWLTLLVIF